MTTASRHGLRNVSPKMVRQMTSSEHLGRARVSHVASYIISVEHLVGHTIEDAAKHMIKQDREASHDVWF
jgi:hypothetical protein